MRLRIRRFRGFPRRGDRSSGLICGRVVVRDPQLADGDKALRFQPEVGHAALRGHGAGEVPVSLAAEGGLQPHEFTHMPGVHHRLHHYGSPAAGEPRVM